MNDLHASGPDRNDAGSKVRRIVMWAVIFAGIGFVANWMLTDTEILSIRICFGLMVAGAGAITGALLCANFTADDSDPSAPNHNDPHHH